MDWLSLVLFNITTLIHTTTHMKTKKLTFLLLLFFPYLIFSQNYNMLNGQTINSCSGVFMDPGGTSNYSGGSSTVTTTICNPDRGDQIFVDFASFNLWSNSCIWGASVDQLLIYEGVGTAGRLINSYSNTNSPGMVFGNGCLTFVFIRQDRGGWLCDRNPGAAGWRANISCQSPCDQSRPFCSNSSYNFQNGTGTTAIVGPNYGCLISQPNPVWYYMQIGVSGPIQINMRQNTLMDMSGTGLDVDFAMWGPFTSLGAGCDRVLSGALAPVQCSFSAAAVETVGLGFSGGTGSGSSTPAQGRVGDFYILLLTNYSNRSGFISFSQTAGSGQTDCSIIPLSLDVLEFKVDKSAGSNQIKWRILSTQNTDYFRVEKSDDGLNWNSIAKVNAVDIEGYEYHFNDMNFMPIENYYRIVSVNKDGFFSYSIIRSIDNSYIGKKVAQIVNLMGQVVDEGFVGIKILIFEDGSTLKVY